MAAGASSPELFTAFIALFVNHSAIGVGTVVGSEIFNHMIISAGSVMYAQTGSLYLDKWVFTRDVSAYFASLVTLVYSLKGSFFPALSRMFEKGEPEQCLYVSINHAAALLVIYMVYVLVCAYFKRFRKWADRDNPRRGSLFNSEAVRANSDTALQIAAAESGEMVSQMNPIYASTGEDQGDVVVRPSMGRMSSQRGSVTGAASANVLKHRWRSSAIEPLSDNQVVTTVHQDTLFPPLNMVKHVLRTYLSSVTNVSLSKVAESPIHLSGYLYTQGTKHHRRWEICDGKDSKHRWRLRYFTIDEHGFHSRKQKSSAVTGPHIRLMNMHDIARVEVVDASTGCFHLILKDLPAKVEQRKAEDDIELKGMGAAAGGDDDTVVDIDAKAQPTLIYRAPGVKSLELFVARLNREIARESGLSREASIRSYRQREKALLGVGTIHRSPDHILHPPVPDGVDPMVHLFSSLVHSFLYPLKFLFYHTIPDVTLEGQRSRYKLSIASSVFWLAILSFTMIECCDTLGVWVGTSPLVMGLTLSAVGTSFPNLYASMLVARQGQGNMAISNAMGSNVFNICIALGLPWFMYIAIDAGKDYSDMKDDGIEVMIFLLILVLLVYYLAIMYHGYQVHRWSVVFAALFAYKFCRLCFLPLRCSLTV